MYIKLPLILAFVFYCNFAYTSDKPSLTVVADEWPPFSGSELPNKGISVDIISAVLRRSGYKTSSEILPWTRIISGARKGEYDVVGSLYPDREVEAFMIYSNPYYETNVKFVKKAGTDITYSDLQSLKPHSIAVGAGFLYELNFDQATFLNKTTVTTTLQGIRMVAHGRVDLTLDNIDVINYAIEKEDTDLAGQIEYLPKTLATRSIHMAVGKHVQNANSIVADFNRTLLEMQNDGSLKKLLAAHGN